MAGTHKQRFTAVRWKALQWFFDHERDSRSVMGRKVPSVYIIHLMIRQGQLGRAETSISYLPNLVLTDKGKADLASKWARRANGYVLAKSKDKRRRRNKFLAHLACKDQGSQVPELSTQWPRPRRPKQLSEPTEPEPEH